jgi:hypothetical protein
MMQLYTITQMADCSSTAKPVRSLDAYEVLGLSYLIDQLKANSISDVDIELLVFPVTDPIYGGPGQNERIGWYKSALGSVFYIRKDPYIRLQMFDSKSNNLIAKVDLTLK